MVRLPKGAKFMAPGATVVLKRDKTFPGYGALPALNIAKGTRLQVHSSVGGTVRLHGAPGRVVRVTRAEVTEAKSSVGGGKGQRRDARGRFA